jgi:hypothetical protein
MAIPGANNLRLIASKMLKLRDSPEGCTENGSATRGPDRIPSRNPRPLSAQRSTGSYQEPVGSPDKPNESTLQGSSQMIHGQCDHTFNIQGLPREPPALRVTHGIVHVTHLEYNHRTIHELTQIPTGVVTHGDAISIPRVTLTLFICINT